MSDMSSQRVTVRIPANLGARLRRQSRTHGLTESDLVRKALEQYLSKSPQARSAYDLAEEAGLIAAVKSAPKDLSSDKRHFLGFGDPMRQRK